jgi:hypothetical protein
VPQTFQLLPRETDGLVGIPLTEPNATHLIGLVVSDREPLPPVAQALWNVARRLELESTIERTLGQVLPARFC